MLQNPHCTFMPEPFIIMNTLLNHEKSMFSKPAVKQMLLLR